MAKIVRQTLREQVAQELRMRILMGELPSGTKLIEQDLAEKLEVSRVPVREALRQLEQEGLIEYISHVGCMVKEFTPEDAYEVYFLRASLEILAVKICEGKFSENTIDKMETILEKMDAVDSIERFDEPVANDNAFHECIIKEANLERLFTLWDSMTNGNKIVFYRGLGRRQYVINNQSRIHKIVLDAIKTGDRKKICTVIINHYMETITSYLHDVNMSIEDFPYKINVDF